MTDYTPGPWTVDHAMITGATGDTVALICDTGEALGTVADWPRLTGPVPADAVNEANARLIAAAPDLLAALEAFAQAFEDDSIEMCDVNDMAIAAIAKARGEG